MKYNININQKGLEGDTEITIIEASVIDWLHTFCGTNNRKINNQKVDGWTWVNCTYLITDMPLLRIKSRQGCSKLLHRLEELGYIQTKTEGRKMFIKTTAKLDGLYFDPIVDNQSSQSDNQTEVTDNHSYQDCQLELPNHNTNIIILDTNTISDKKITLPIQRGKTAVTRLTSIYDTLFENLYGFKNKNNLPLTNSLFKKMLETYSEVQIACLLTIYFDWSGMDNNNNREKQWLLDNAHPILIFKSKLSVYEAYARNVSGYGNDFDDDKKMLSIVAKHIVELSTR